jgi:short-subunit dehydrogenase
MAAYAASKAGAEAFADALRAEVKHLGVDVGVGYFSFIDTDMVRGADSHPAVGPLRAESPFSRTYPLSDAGQAIAAGIENRSRWVVVPRWARALLLLRTALAPLVERGSRGFAEEGDARFEADVKARGAKAASAPVGPGGEAAAREAVADHESAPRS